MEDIVSEVRRHFLRLLQTSMQLLRLVKGVVPAQSIPLTLCILLQKQRRGCNLIDHAASTNTDCHAALLSIEHEFLHV